MPLLPEIIASDLSDNKDLPKVVSTYLETHDENLAASLVLQKYEWSYEYLGAQLIKKAENDPDLPRVFEFFVLVAVSHPTIPNYTNLLKGLLDTLLKENRSDRSSLSEALCSSLSLRITELKPFFSQYFIDSYKYTWDYTPATSPTPQEPFHNPLLNLIWQHVGIAEAKEPKNLASAEGILRAIVHYRRDLLNPFLDGASKLEDWELARSWQIILEASPDFDLTCLEFCENLDWKREGVAFEIIYHLNERREGIHLSKVIETSQKTKAQLKPEAIEVGLAHYRSELLDSCQNALRALKSPWLEYDYSCPEYRELFDLMFSNWEPKGRTLFRDLVTGMSRYHFLEQLKEGSIPLQPIAHPDFHDILLSFTKKQSGSDLIDLWQRIFSGYPSIFENEAWDLLSSKSKNLRSLAAHALASGDLNSTSSRAAQFLNESKADARLGGVELLKNLGESSVPALLEAHQKEKSQKVQTEIETVLASLGKEISTREETLTTEDLLEQIDSDKRIKLPKADWFDLSSFPLIQNDGKPLTEKAITFLIQKQSKHKTIEAAPGIAPLLEFIDRRENADSALALLNQWLDSDQEAKDRWALVLAGLFGDNRVIAALTPKIQPWCENARHKLAEYAAQAISLLATNEALMILDTLANRYRSKFKNIGKACTEAFHAAAKARGVSPDELGDLVVPELGFNSDCQQEFDGGKIIAILQPDFKLTWLNPDTDKETKTTPSSLSNEGKEELKTLRKILREAVKGQTARLEQMLVRQRRWPVTRWQELFEEHPLLQSYAASLVWGIYHADNTLLRTFRRYPNGILAHGSGELEDLEEQDTFIGIVHPLELSEEDLSTWRDHLGRFKVKPPFEQLDRPVETLEDGQSNRREITFTEKIQISGGTFLSRMNKRNWVRGSVIDAGGVTSYYKPFEAAGVEAILFLEEYWVGFDPMDSFPLGKALFAELSTVERGSYIYDDPNPDDPRVLSFGQVPPIIYSEVIADLKALVAGQEKS